MDVVWCKDVNVDVLKFINHGKESYDSIGKVSKSKASVMIKVLNEYQNKSKEVPASVVGYQTNWR